MSTPFLFIVTSLALSLGAGYYWGQDQYPLALIKLPVVKWLWSRGPTIDGYPTDEGQSVLQVIGHGVDCGVCAGQWAAFGLSWWLFVSPFTNFWEWLVIAVALNSINFWLVGEAKRRELL